MPATTPFFVSIGDGRVHCMQEGTGPRLLICFHGYSRDAGTFLPLARYTGDRYTLVSIDLPFHGRTEWPDGKAMRLQHLVELVDALRRRNGVDKCAVAGFSLGGRVALSLLQAAPETVSIVLLAASDGLVPNPVYGLATRTAAGRRLFADVLRRPERYLALMQRLARQRLIPALQYEWAVNYIQAPWTRTLLGKVWPSLRHLIPNPRRVRAAAARYSVPIHLFMGQHDTVIPLRHAERFAAGSEGVHLQVMNKGHRLLDDDTFRRMAAVLP